MSQPNDNGIEDSRCRFLVELAAAPGPDLFTALETLAAADRLGALILPAPLVVGGERLAELRRLPTALFAYDTVAASPQLDGVVLTDPDAPIGEVRASWADGAIVMALAGLSADRAMSAGEQGADGVLFAAEGPDEAVSLLDCVRWWAELFVLPVAVRPLGDWHSLVVAGADFLLIAPPETDPAAADWARDLMERVAQAEAARPVPAS